jgi:hypothetical protein
MDQSEFPNAAHKANWQRINEFAHTFRGTKPELKQMRCMRTKDSINNLNVKVAQVLYITQMGRLVDVIRRFDLREDIAE